VTEVSDDGETCTRITIVNVLVRLFTLEQGLQACKEEGSLRQRRYHEKQ